MEDAEGVDAEPTGAATGVLVADPSESPDRGTAGAPASKRQRRKAAAGVRQAAQPY